MVFISTILFIFIAAIPGSTTRDFDALESRRKYAGKLFAKGMSQADIARELLVSRQSVSRWYNDWCSGGVKALRAAGRAGRLPLLSSKDIKSIERQLLRGSLANGYATDMWTLERVAEVIEKETGIRYHPGHVWRILRQMGWSRQRPARKAKERNDAAIVSWVKNDWPRVKKTPGAVMPGSASKTSRGSASYLQ